MNGAIHNLPYIAQAIGLVATLVGAVVGTAGLIWAYIAAGRAKGAREAAELAREAAMRAGRIAQLGDLIADMQELQAMLARADFLAIAGKANLLRGRIARFKTEAYTELIEEENASLDLAREHMASIAEVAAVGKARQAHRLGKVQIAYGKANEALNMVAAMQSRSAEGE